MQSGLTPNRHEKASAAGPIAARLIRLLPRRARELSHNQSEMSSCVSLTRSRLRSVTPPLTKNVFIAFVFRS